MRKFNVWYHYPDDSDCALELDYDGQGDVLTICHRYKEHPDDVRYAMGDLIEVPVKAFKYFADIVQRKEREEQK